MRGRDEGGMEEKDTEGSKEEKLYTEGRKEAKILRKMG